MGQYSLQLHLEHNSLDIMLDHTETHEWVLIDIALPTDENIEKDTKTYHSRSEESIRHLLMKSLL